MYYLEISKELRQITSFSSIPLTFKISFGISKLNENLPFRREIYCFRMLELFHILRCKRTKVANNLCACANLFHVQSLCITIYQI